MNEERTKYKTGRGEGIHTPREIVNQCILRWEVSILVLGDGIEHLEAEVQHEHNFEIAKLKERIQAGRDIITEFDLNHVQ